MTAYDGTLLLDSPGPLTWLGLVTCGRWNRLSANVCQYLTATADEPRLAKAGRSQIAG